MRPLPLFDITSQAGTPDAASLAILGRDVIESDHIEAVVDASALSSYIRQALRIGA